MSVLNENQLLGASGAGGDYEIEQSLRFDDGRGSYLSRTPSSAGNRRTWTFSAWVKRGKLNSLQFIFCGGLNTSGNLSTQFQFDANNKLYFYSATGGGGSDINLVTTSFFRDPSAYYHIVLLMDTTQSTASNRVKIYVNGEQITALDTATYPSQHYDTAINNNVVHNISNLNNLNVGLEFDGYMGEVNFIDGLALTPDSFGETGDYGEWKPIEYAGTYGTNGFYLPFKQDYTVEGFSAVVYEGTGAARYVGGTGFSPDFTWIKKRSNVADHRIFDNVRGVTKALKSNATQAEGTETQALTAFNTDGFTLGTDDFTNGAGSSFVAWNWDMGATTASNTDGTITSSVRANQAYGQSIVSYTGNATNASTIGHGLSSTPTMVIVKSRTTAAPWKVGGSVIQAVYGDGSNNSAFLSLNTTAAADQETTGFQGNTATTIGVGANSDTNSNGANYIAYCFHDVANYSKFGSYSGSGASGNAITTGFAPAFVMIKSAVGTANDWFMYDNTRKPTNPNDFELYANNSNAEYDSGRNVSFTSTGFELDTANYVNNSGVTYIYMAFADTREYAYWLDQSGNNNDWTSEGGLTESDVMVDSPTNNFATLNPLSSFTGYATAVLSEGNLQASLPDNAEGKGSISVSSGKWYFEGFAKTATNNKLAFGIHKADGIFTGGTSIPNNSAAGLVWFGHNGIQGYASDSSYGTFTTGDIIGVKLDMDSKTIQFTKNGTAQGTKDFSSANFDTVVASVFSGQTSNVGVLNFGQDSSFAGNKTPQGNQDANGIGDFYHSVPSGFLSLCTKSLPSVDVIPSEHFNPVLYTGNGSTQSITAELTPDLVWMKPRSEARNHRLVDQLRGNGVLSSNTTDAEATGGDLVLTSTGFNLTSGSSNYNGNGYTYVAWNWKAGGTAVSNTNGSITSQVSANVDAGFSIVSYTGTGSAGTVGTGLSQRADLIITKGRSDSGNWVTWHKDLTGAFDSNGGYAYLNSTGAAAATTVFYDGTGFTSSVFKWRGGNENVNQSSRTYLSYCFHSVESYSKVGSYTGDGLVGSTGTFVYCGFRPAYILIKAAGLVRGWQVQDSKRSSYNGTGSRLEPNSSAAESTNSTTHVIDFLSNGFKLRHADNDINAQNQEYIYLAFAESPFKHSNAR